MADLSVQECVAYNCVRMNGRLQFSWNRIPGLWMEDFLECVLLQRRWHPGFMSRVTYVRHATDCLLPIMLLLPELAACLLYECASLPEWHRLKSFFRVICSSSLIWRVLLENLVSWGIAGKDLPPPSHLYSARHCGTSNSRHLLGPLSQSSTNRVVWLETSARSLCASESLIVWKCFLLVSRRCWLQNSCCRLLKGSQD